MIPATRDITISDVRVDDMRKRSGTSYKLQKDSTFP
jgi:hypothetical protein